MGCLLYTSEKKDDIYTEMWNRYQVDSLHAYGCLLYTSGVFLKRGQYTYPLDKARIWHFVPLVNVGDKVQASAWLGQVDENFQPLKDVYKRQTCGLIR